MKVFVRVETATDRERFLDACADVLDADEAVVRVVDLVGASSLVLTVPTSPRAEVLACETPRVLPGGYTSLVSYVRVPLGDLDAIVHVIGSGEHRSRTSTLAPERVGRGVPAPSGIVSSGCGGPRSRAARN